MRADRLLSILLLLQTQGKMTAQRLADTLEVSRRTILRDLDALTAAGIPVYAEGGHGGGIVLDERYRTTLTGLRENELRTVFISDNSQLLAELGLGDAARSTLLKLRAGLPSAQQPLVDHMRQRILIDPASWWRDEPPLPAWEQLQQAVYEDRCIRAQYERPNGDVNERILEPYSLVAKSGTWYLVAVYAGELHTYRVARFRTLTLLDTHFHRREDFDLPTYWHVQLQQMEEVLSDYRCTLRVHENGMHLVRKVVPRRQYHSEAADADGWTTVHVQLDAMELALMLVLGLGAHARVVAPQALHTAVLQTAQAILSVPDDARRLAALTTIQTGEIGPKSP